MIGTHTGIVFPYHVLLSQQFKTVVSLEAVLCNNHQQVAMAKIETSWDRSASTSIQTWSALRDNVNGDKLQWSTFQFGKPSNENICHTDNVVYMYSQQ